MKRLALTAVLLAGTALATNASAATFTSDHCGGGGCGPQPNGFATITGTQLGTDLVGITITPLNGNSLVNGGQTTFTFNLIGNPTITYVGLPSTFDVVNSTTNTQTAGSIHQAAFGNFEYGIDYTLPGASSPFFGPLSFTVSGNGLTLASFAELSTGGDVAAFFALDILSGTTGQTGLVDCCVGQPTPFGVTPVPIPSPLALFEAGLVGIGMIRRRKKQSRLNVA